jgi:ABC-type transport system involved in multi-copper enzyme maturation permease subunit
MKTKEVLEARWKVGIFALITILVTSANSAFYQVVGNIADRYGTVPPMFQNLIPEHLANTFTTFVWLQWFAVNGPFLLAFLAALLGGGLIANEVSRGTIFFLLSKPISRERILLTKYGVSLGLLLAVSLIGSLVLAIMGIILGQSLDLLRLLLATLLLWLATLLPLGLALFFSVILSDSFRAMACSLLITFAFVLLPASLPNGWNWSLWRYWGNMAAYLNGSFPLKEYLVCLIAAMIRSSCRIDRKTATIFAALPIAMLLRDGLWI